MHSDAYFVALNRIEKVTPLRFQKLLAYFENDAERIWRASRAEWIRAGIEIKAVEEIWSEKNKIEPELEMKALEKIGAKVLPITSEKYPALLREIYAAPPVLFTRGEFPSARDAFSIAVVGSRVISSYGRQATELITRELVLSGVAIISGLALGVDALAHQTTVNSNGRTVAVLGCGIDQIYPPANRKLATMILERGGAIISEFNPGVEPTAYNFPQRNRIIAGLSRGTLVVEAREKSGALITGQIALEEGREVFAVPGSIFSENSVGANNLLKAGAKVVTSANDVLETLNFKNVGEKIQTQAAFTDTPEEAALLRILTREPLHADELTRASELSASTVGAMLSLLEMKGLARNLGGGQWVRT